MNRTEALDTARRLRMDLTNAQAKLTDVIEYLKGLPDEFDASTACPTCGVKTKGPLSLAEHIHTSHDGPVPAHWLEAERLAGIG